MLKTKQENEGITLVALVVTIVVLLILAGVTITALTGDNGVLSQVARAKQENEKTGIIEEIRLDIAAKQADNLGSINEDEFYEILGKYGTVSNDENTLTTTKGNYEILISDIYSGNIENSLVTTPLSSWEYTLDDNNKTITLTKYIGADAKIFIPENFEIDNNIYLTKIGNTVNNSGTFNGPFVTNTILTDIKFDDDIVISDVILMFNKCLNLKNVYNLPGTYTNMYYTFSECRKLSYVPEISESVTNMYATFRAAFKGENTDENIIKVKILSNNVSNMAECFTLTQKKVEISINNNTTTYNTVNSQIVNWNSSNTWNNVFLKGEKIIDIACWGDSLTVGSGGNGTSYVNYLKTNLVGRLVNPIQLGIGGEKANAIAMRQGGLKTFADTFTIPSDTNPVEITLKDEYGNLVTTLANEETISLNPCYIKGIEGKIYNSNGKTYFKRNTSGQEKTIEDNTPITTNSMIKYSKNAEVNIIWSGQNDSGVDFNLQQIINLQKKMIEYSGSDNYVIIGLLYAGDEVNNLMASVYGEHFLDIRPYLSKDGTNVVSADYKSDSIHLNADGYTIVGQQVYNKLISLGYITE